MQAPHRVLREKWQVQKGVQNLYGPKVREM